MRFATSLVALAALPAALAAQTTAAPRTRAPQPTSDSITIADLMTRLYLIADDSMRGRPTGSPEHLVATAYLAAEARRLGLRPAGDDGGFFQNVPMQPRVDASGSIRLGDRTWTAGEDFAVVAPSGGSVRRASEATIALGGTAGESASWITAGAAQGRAILLRQNARQVSVARFVPSVRAGEPFATAAVVIVPGFARGTMVGRRGPQLADPAAARTELPPTLVVSNALFDALLAAEGTRLELALSFTSTPVPARNVVAVLPGSDPALRGQYVAIGAHSDHDPVASRARDHDSVRTLNASRRKVAPRLPAPGSRPSRPDSIYNGADDDGSGTVALLEIAEAFATMRERPRRSLLFVWHTAEEQGLLGADYFVGNPTVPLDSIVAQLNMDMIGRGGADDIEGGGPRYLQLVGSRRLSRELGDLIERINRERGHGFAFDYGHDADGHPERIYCRSDHAAYARHGIPVTFFHTGLHLDYHQVTDEPQYIDYTKLFNVSSLVFDVALDLANRAGRPKLDGPKPDPKAACRQ